MHNPRGSNNRLNEGNNNRNNGNRLFDSQNNNRGGYNVGDGTGNGDGNSGAGEGIMKYYASSILPIEWTNQHSCGQENNDCQMIIQYSCDNGDNSSTMRDGDNTNTPNADTAENADNDTGRHEPKSYYDECRTRKRNKGLFTADQNLNGDTAKYTRQNPNGTRRGLECPEERDYYPYWHPTMWRDVAILTNNPGEYCDKYQEESQNVKGKNYCSVIEHNNEVECEANGGTWRTQAPWGIKKPECLKAAWNRDNHLGNAQMHTGDENSMAGAYTNSYNWTLPNVNEATCVLRLRYNISTGDYPWDLNATHNGKDYSPVTNDPVVDIGLEKGLTLAINTAQFGRTFQDRSHIFRIIPRPSNIPATSVIHNLNVRGRRGNIVQNYPAVEYDFVPNRLEMAVTDYVHWQWTGSNNNPNNDGEGKARTDRSNVAQIKNLADNYPMRPEDVTMFDSVAEVQEFATLGGTDKKLDDVDPYFNGGLKQMSRGTYFYMCTRNNNFSNRSQKGTIIVGDMDLL